MIEAELAAAIRQAVKAEFNLDVEAPEVSYAQAGFGDYATNVAFSLAKTAGEPPRAIAERLAVAIKHEALERAEAAGAGYVNLYLKPAYWQGQLAAITPDYAGNKLGKGQKVQVEFISANPTGPLTIGNARGGFIGDVLARVLERSAYDVTREYYFNDGGTQISKLLESVKMEAGLIDESADRQYQGDYIKELAAELKDELAKLPDVEAKKLLTMTIIERHIKPAIAAMGISYDVWFNELNLIQDGTLAETLDRLDKLGLVFKKEGATWLKTGDLGDERSERVIVKANGDPTYMAPDIAYHADIFGKRGFDYAIKVLGPDHIAQFPSVYAAVHQLFPDKQLRMASYQWLRVIRDGKEVKVSKRLGQFITIKDLIDQVGLPVARFLTLMRSADSHMDFDLNLATEQSAKNPYYYVMYAYARAHSILAKAAEQGLEPATKAGQLSEAELAVVRTMVKLPGLVKDITADYGVHRLTFYGLELAKLFTSFYETTKVIGLPPEEAKTKLYFVQQFVIFMEIYWSLLGIEPQQRMDHEAS